MNTDTDFISVETLLNRVDELEELREEYAEKMDDWQANADNVEELETLTAIAEELRGNGGDVQWRGDWYPDYLYADRYFTDYIREMLIDCGTVPANLPEWVEIDWDATAENLKVDYASIDIDGDTYWYRCN